MENPSGVSSDSTSSSSLLIYKRDRANEEKEETTSGNKKTKFVLPTGFLEPLNILEEEDEILAPIPLSSWKPDDSNTKQSVPYCRQFWKAGDYDEVSTLPGRGGDTTLIDGMDHVRVHPRFLHSNATSHKWVLGAVAELLDNSLDEAINGGTYCHINMLLNKKDSSRMLLVEDNGGGMSPGTMRHCMSLGFSGKSKLANTIGQYGNGFKTSTMRIGADVIVFSRCPGKDGGRATQSIDYFRTLPILDYEKNGKDWSNIVPASSSSVDWNKNVETIVQWSPYASEAELLEQFNFIKGQGTRIIIYNLWEDEEGALELDFDSDIHDIQIEVPTDYPKSKQFLTYTHSLRSYASILYLKPPLGFGSLLRGQDVVHHNIVNNMFKVEDIKYKPTGLDSAVNADADADTGMVGKMGFHMDAKAHLDIQGFSVYHRNRLIKPFWRVWNSVVEANFIKPAHDKQDFEKTIMLSRLEWKLAHEQKNNIGINSKVLLVMLTKQKNYVESRRYFSRSNSAAKEIQIPVMEKCDSLSIHSESARRETLRSAQRGEGKQMNGCKNHEGTGISVENGKEPGVTVNVKEKPVDQNLASERNEQEADPGTTSRNNLITENLELKNRRKRTNEMLSSDLTSKQDRGRVLEVQTNKAPQTDAALLHVLPVENRGIKSRGDLTSKQDRARELEVQTNEAPQKGAALLHELQVENRELKARIKELKEKHLQDLKVQREKLEEKHLYNLELQKEKCRSLEAELKETKDNFEVSVQEQDKIVEIFSEERTRRDVVEEKLANKLKDASTTIKKLQDKVFNLEKKKSQPIR
ncbi:hypothetical protein MKW92_039020 [Papaver armeniacum]|nr:hypothetical protein MKW92_039020 [Papaver armeniacum]